MYRITNNLPEVLLVHPGGPFFARKDAGSWSIPKGEFTEPENAVDAAIREFNEELGTQLTSPLIPLSPISQKSGKKVFAWATAGNLDTSAITCNTFTIEWPPKSGKMTAFPEIDCAEWFTPEAAKEKINPAQIPFIDELLALLAGK